MPTYAKESVRVAVANAIRRYSIEAIKYLIDDVKQEASLAAWRAVLRVQAIDVQNPEGYVYKCAKRAIDALIAREWQEEREVPAVGDTPYQLHDEPRANVYDGPRTISHHDPDAPTTSDRDPVDDDMGIRAAKAMAQLRLACRDERDLRIIELKAAGYSHKEVADILKIRSKATISKRLDAIAVRAGIPRRKQNIKNCGND